jgi:hypothetical protein
VTLVKLDEPRRAIAFDPGITTGVANGLLLPEGHMEVSGFQDKLNTKDLFEYLQSSKPHYIIYERFDYRNRARDRLVLFSRDLIGVIDLYSKLTETPTFRYMPVEVMRYFTDNYLKTEKVFKPNLPHYNDAMRHLLHWYTFGYGYQFNKNGYVPA